MNISKIGALSFLFISCVAHAQLKSDLTFESVPYGAKIFYGEKEVGRTPLKQTYTSTAAETKQGEAFPSFTAVWPSGARLTKSSRIPLPGGPIILHFQRPDDWANLYLDLAHAETVNAGDPARVAQAQAATASAREPARATQAQVPQLNTDLTFVSVPSGAMIYDGQKALGSTPIRQIHTSSGAQTRLGEAAFQLTVVWPSGARSTETVRFPLTAAQRTISFSRPIDAPNLHLDLAHAETVDSKQHASIAQAQAQQASIAQAQAEQTANRAAGWSFLGELLGTVVKARQEARQAPIAPTLPPMPRPPLDITCSTMGNTTNCRER